MHIALFTSQFPSRVNTFFARDVRALLEAGIDIDIFPLYPLNSNLWQYVPEILTDNILPREKVHHVSVLHAASVQILASIMKNRQLREDLLSIAKESLRFGLIPCSKSLYAVLKGAIWANRYTGQFDHILAYWGNYAGTSAYIFHKINHKDTDYSFFLHAGTDLYRQQIFLRQKLLEASRIFTVCEFNQRFIQKLYPSDYELIADKIHIHHLGLDLENFEFVSTRRIPNKVIAIGRLAEEKGFDYLLKAGKILVSWGYDIQIEIVGDGGQRQALLSLSRDLGLEDIVTFRGWLSFDEVRQTLKSAALLVHPSPGLGDAVPTVIKEAMALGTPVIGTRVAGIPELIEDKESGLLVPPKDVTKLAQAIKELLDNASMREEYATRARCIAEAKFDLWKNGKKLASLLSN